MEQTEVKVLLQQCFEDEARYQFPAFSHADAWELGKILVETCREYEGPLAVEIEIDRVVVFRYFPDGTGEYHEQWLRRKRNTVNTLERSSLRFFCELTENGEDMVRDWLLDPMEYAYCGGAFPIKQSGGSVIGVAAVSGLPHLRDNAALMEGIRRYLSKKKT
ncbi:MAG: heme-binding protein [Eubacteriales bacterium]|nr:heme-binding protein [Eubacteriales bacterium]